MNAKLAITYLSAGRQAFEMGVSETYKVFLRSGKLKGGTQGLLVLKGLFFFRIGSYQFCLS